MMIKAAVDWGSTSFRGFTFDPQGNFLDSVSGPYGIKSIVDKQFPETLLKHIGHWLSADDTVLLSGMITSRNGWVESTYLSCPVNLSDLLTHGTRLHYEHINFVFLPGVKQVEPLDVMRGEELQLLGAKYSGICIIPGTHSKWVHVENRSVIRFRTIPTGELFDILVNNSLIGALLEEHLWDQACFFSGVECGYEGSTTISDLFTARTSVLLQQKSGSQSYSWLSGLLIGNEIREGLCMLPDNDRPMLLIGSASLCNRYQAALDFLGHQAMTASPDVTLHGFQTIIEEYQ